MRVFFYSIEFKIIYFHCFFSFESLQAVPDEASKSNNTKEVTCRDVSNAYCAIAEIYLTDAWFVIKLERLGFRNSVLIALVN